MNSPKSLIAKKWRLSVVELHWRSQCFITLLKRWPGSLLLPTGSWYFPVHFVLFVSFFWLISVSSFLDNLCFLSCELPGLPLKKEWCFLQLSFCSRQETTCKQFSASLFRFFIWFCRAFLLPYRQALEIREKTFGKSHPSVATALNNLAVVLCLQVNNVTVVIWLP